MTEHKKQKVSKAYKRLCEIYSHPRDTSQQDVLLYSQNNCPHDNSWQHSAEEANRLQIEQNERKIAQLHAENERLRALGKEIPKP